jgi:hypothetical protein
MAIGFWTADTIAQLIDLWGKELSASVIAKTMTISRNAVLGKVHRLGLSHRVKTGAASSRIKKIPVEKPAKAQGYSRPKLTPIVGPPSGIALRTGASSFTIKRRAWVEVSKNELRAQLAQAVKNTAALDVA